MKRKVSIILLMLLVSLSLLAGCSDEEGTAAEDKENGQATTISFIHWRGEDKEVFENIIKDFEKENPNINVEMTVYPSEQYQSNAQMLVRDGEVGDVFPVFPGSQFEIVTKADLYMDLSNEEFVSNFNNNLLKAGEKDGKQFALPYQLVYNQPVYNKAIFEELNIEPAKDWEGFLEMCQTLKDNGYTPIAFPGADIGPGQLMNSMMMNNAPDVDIFSKLEAGEVKVTDQWWVKTLENFKELADKGYFQENSLGTKHDGAIALFAQEKAAMLGSGSYAMAGAKEQNPELEMQLLAPITVAEDEIEYEGIHTTTFMLGVNKNSKHPEEAKKFIEFLSKPEIASDYANGTGQHLTVKDVEYTSEELKNTAKWMDKKTRFQPRYLISNIEVEKALISSIQSVIGGTEPKQAAEEAQAIIDQNIK